MTAASSMSSFASSLAVEDLLQLPLGVVHGCVPVLVALPSLLRVGRLGVAARIPRRLGGCRWGGRPPRCSRPRGAWLLEAARRRCRRAARHLVQVVLEVQQAVLGEVAVAVCSRLLPAKVPRWVAKKKRSAEVELPLVVALVPLVPVSEPGVVQQVDETLRAGLHEGRECRPGRRRSAVARLAWGRRLGRGHCALAEAE
eukprot:1044991-Pyramimonas_sp.AAC.1